MGNKYNLIRIYRDERAPVFEYIQRWCIIVIQYIIDIGYVILWNKIWVFYIMSSETYDVEDKYSLDSGLIISGVDKNISAEELNTGENIDESQKILRETEIKQIEELGIKIKEQTGEIYEDVKKHVNSDLWSAVEIILTNTYMYDVFCASPNVYSNLNSEKIAEEIKKRDTIENYNKYVLKHLQYKKSTNDQYNIKEEYNILNEAMKNIKGKIDYYMFIENTLKRQIPVYEKAIKKEFEKAQTQGGFAVNTGEADGGAHRTRRRRNRKTSKKSRKMRSKSHRRKR